MITPTTPEQECEYCGLPLLEGCNEFGSMFEEEGSSEYACPNNPNQFPRRDNLDQRSRTDGEMADPKDDP